MPSPTDNRVSKASDLLGRATGMATTAVLSEPDGLTAFRVATHLSEAFTAAAADVAALRSQAVGTMRRQGLSYAQIARQLGISKARAAQLSPPDSNPNGGFWPGR